MKVALVRTKKKINQKKNQKVMSPKKKKVKVRKEINLGKRRKIK